MSFHLTTFLPDDLEAAARAYDVDGYVVVDGLGDSVTSYFRPHIARAIGIDEDRLDAFFDPNSEPVVLAPEVRQRLSRVDTSTGLADSLFAALHPVVERFLGPVVHISSNYHVQVKGGDQPAVDHGGGLNEYREVQGQYLIHQDFTGARIPTSPSQLTVWVAQNDCPDWTLRLYPGSHRLGMLNHEWVALDDPWLAPFGPFVDLQARRGRAIIFNSLLLHATSNPGRRRRVSCDIRFFPLCGFLPSSPRVLGSDPATRLAQGRNDQAGVLLQAPVRETLAYLGASIFDPDVPLHSISNWANYLERYLRDDSTAVAHMVRFVNQSLGRDTPDVYLNKFHNQPIHVEPLVHAMDGIRSKSRIVNNFEDFEQILRRCRAESEKREPERSLPVTV